MRDSLVPLLDMHTAAFDMPFQWGVRDCVLFAAGWVTRVTGRVLIPEGLSWSDKDTAQAAMNAMGCADLRELASRFLEPAPLLSARLGDILARDFPRLGITLGICTGAAGSFVHERAGIVRFGLSACHACWRVDSPDHIGRSGAGFSSNKMGVANGT